MASVYPTYNPSRSSSLTPYDDQSAMEILHNSQVPCQISQGAAKRFGTFNGALHWPCRPNGAATEVQRVNVKGKNWLVLWGKHVGTMVLNALGCLIPYVYENRLKSGPPRYISL